jgi:outer membrane protein assembly factor BamB
MNGSPSVTRSLVFAGANDGTMYAVHRSSGTLAFKVAMPEGCGHVFSSAAIADNGMVYFTCNSPTGGRRRRRLAAGEGSLSDADVHVAVGLVAQQMGVLFAINPSLHL